MSPACWPGCCGSSAGASCRSGSGPGMAARRAPPGGRPSSCGAIVRCEGCCGTQASWGWLRHTSPASSMWTATWPRGCAWCGRRPRRGGSAAPGWPPGRVRCWRRCGSVPSGLCRPRRPARSGSAAGRTPGAVPARSSPITTTCPSAFTGSSWIRRWRTRARTGGQAAPTARWLTRSATSLTWSAGGCGCGWGSLAVHAASRCGASVTAVTLSAQQGRYTRRRVRDLGLGPQVHVRVGDWRDLGGEPYDAIACIEMGEHVGAVAYPEFCARLAGLLRPGGLVVVQQMARRGRPGGGPFIESFIAPDMHMRPVGETVSLLEDAGLEVTEVEGMRQDYHRTIRAWQAAFEHRISEAEALIGSEAVRVWRLYLSGAALAFEQGRMSVHQILASRPGPAPATPAPKTAARPAAVSASAGAHAASARRARART